MSRPLWLLSTLLLTVSAPAFAADGALLPEGALRLAERRNPEVAEAEALAEAEEELVLSAGWLESPRIGLMREQNLNDMQLEMGPMTSWSVTQEVMFPLKYFVARKARSHRAEAARSEASDKRLEIRQRVLTAYYNVYAARRIGALLAAQRETLREIARAAEARRATGAVPQQDEMKAHVEQTRIENEIILQAQETSDMEAMLEALLAPAPGEEIRVPIKDVPAPKLTVTDPSAELMRRAQAGSKGLQAEASMLEEARSERRMATLGLAPDFMLNYRRAFENAPANAYSFSIEATIPLWFFARELPEIRSARAREAAAEARLERMKREVDAESKSLGPKVASYAKLLQIYETSLIPQSVSMLNSSRAAYSAGRTSFVELLDSERSLYMNRISYYETLAKFVESVTRLERTLGSPISDLPFLSGS